MARRYQVKIYSTDFTTLQATVADFALSSASVQEEINAAYNLTFVLDRSDSAFAFVARGKTVELNNTVTGVKRHYRIVRVTDVYVNRDPGVEVYCEGLHYDLAAKVFFDADKFVEQTPTTIITALVAEVGWTVGTVTPTAKVTLEYNFESILALLQKLAELTGYELDYTTTPGGTPTRQVHLRRMGNQSSTSTITLAKNLLELKRDAEIAKGNIVYGIGGAGKDRRVMTLANATHRITAINSNTLTLDSTKILGAANGYTSMSIKKPDGSSTAITSAEKSTLDKVTVASAAGLSVGDKVRFIFTASGAPVEFVLDVDRIAAESARSITYRNEKLTDVENLIGPATVSALSGTYTAGSCEGWDSVGVPTRTENTDTDYIIHGTKSQKVVVATYTQTPSSVSAASSTVESQMEGTFTYKAALLGPDGEGPLGSASNSVAVSYNGITVTVTLGSVSSHIIGARVYRSKDSGAYKHIKDILSGDSYVFIDTIDEAAAGDQPPADTTKVTGGIGIKIDFDTVVDKEYAAVIYLVVTSGKVRLVLDVGDKVPDDSIQSAKKATGTSPPTKKYTVSISGVIATQTTGTLYILAHEGPATFYVDSAMIVESPYAPDHKSFVADNSATTLWYETYDDLVRIKAESDLKQYAVSFADLYEAGIGTDLINLGDLITITDANFSINDSVRVVAKRFNALEPWKDGSIELASQYRRARDEVYERKRREQEISASLQSQITNLTEQLSTNVGSDRRGYVIFREIEVTESSSLSVEE